MSSQGQHLAELRERVRRIERPATAAHGVVSFGVTAIDRALPDGGLARGALHEIVGAGGDEEDGALAAAFAAGCAAQLAAVGGGGLVLWCLAQSDLYGPGLAELRLDPARLVLVRAPRNADILWAMEEGLRTAGLAAVVGEVGALSAVASRRLQLAAERSGATAFVLRRWRNGDEAACQRNLPNAAASRWRISALPSPPTRLAAPFPPPPRGGRGLLYEPGIGHPRWRVELLRCRGAAPGCWEVEIRKGEMADAADALSVAAPLADRPAAPDGREALSPERYRRAG